MNFHRNHWLLLGTIFFGFIGLGIIIAIAPAYWVQTQAQVQKDADSGLSELEQRGLEVYIAEGCVACHTQQVRPVKMDRVWGRPSAPRDYTDLGGPMDVWRPYTPAVLGSSRIGPDLSNVGNRQPSKTWQYMHLYNPRSVVEASIMPAYPWLFDVVLRAPDDATTVSVPDPYGPAQGQVVPNARGKALVAYLLSLKQPADKQTASGAGDGDNQGESAPDQAAGGPNGATLYGNNCASCHQASGQGVPGAFPPLAGDPVVTAKDPSEHIDIVLNGAHGRTIDGKTYSAQMPGFASQFNDAEIAAIVNHERTSWDNDAPTVTAADVAKQRGEEDQ